MPFCSVFSFQSNPDPSAATISFADAADRWFRFKSRRWEPSTARRIQFLMRPWLYFMGRKRLAEIRPLDIQAIYLHLLDEGLSPFYINDHRNKLRSVWLFCFRNGLVSHDVFSEDSWPQLPAVANHQEFALDEEQEGRLIGSLPELWRRPVGAFIRLDLRTAMRKSTIYRLTWSMVSPDWWLDVPPFLVRNGARERLVKNAEHLRFPLDMFLVVVHALEPRGAPDDPLIPGLPFSTYLNDVLKAAAKAVGLEAKIFNPTELRRIALDRFLRMKPDLDAAMRYFGWRRATTLTEHYRFRLGDGRRMELAQNLQRDSGPSDFQI